jgi:hypothetical protein
VKKEKAELFVSLVLLLTGPAGSFFYCRGFDSGRQGGRAVLVITPEHAVFTAIFTKKWADAYTGISD